MSRTFRQQTVLVIAILFAILPFGFGLLRAVTTGTDFRYLWVATASFIGAALVMARGKGRGRGGVLFALSAAALIVSTLCGAFAARLLGTKIGLGMLIVTLSFAVCWLPMTALAIGSRAADPAA